MRPSAPFAALAALFTLAACADSTTTPTVDAPLNADVAEVVADAALEDLAVMNAVAPATGLGAAFGPFGGRGLGDRAGLERNRTVTAFDAEGVQQEAYDALTTASLHIVTMVEGDISREHFSAAVSRLRDLWVTGLAGEEVERTWNGSGESEVHRTRTTDANGTRSYEMEASATIDDVVRAVDRDAQPWPLSGTITREVAVTIVNGPRGDETRQRTTVLTFNGTQYVTLLVDGEAFEVDLAARAADRASRRKNRP